MGTDAHPEKRRQEAMTSEQVLWLTATLLLLSGCSLFLGRGADPLESPYPSRRVWAVAPLHNESGSLQADGVALADHLAHQLETASNLDVLPVNRVLMAIDHLGITQATSPHQARQLLNTLGVDALVVGTITAYDPYDPPTLGLAVELYVNQRVDQADRLDVRRLARASTDPQTLPSPATLEPATTSTVSAVFDAADPEIRKRLMRYARNRGPVRDGQSWHLYRISMDLYSEFVSYVMSWRLLQAETRRITSPPATQPAPS